MPATMHRIVVTAVARMARSYSRLDFLGVPRNAGGDSYAAVNASRGSS